MPGTSRAPKRSRVPRRKRRPRDAAASLDKVCKLTLEMEEPLNDLENLIQALRFIGYGMETHHADEGHPISSLAWSAVGRLAEVRETWRGIYKAAQKTQ
jgi:hypothetical protein